MTLTHTKIGKCFPENAPLIESGYDRCMVVRPVHIKTTIIKIKESEMCMVIQTTYLFRQLISMLKPYTV